MIINLINNTNKVNVKQVTLWKLHEINKFSAYI